MAVLPRRTAVLEIRSPTQASELLPLDVQRPYSFVLDIEGRQVAGGVFESPLGDEAWRNVVSAMREATDGGASQPDAYRRQTETVKDAGRRLFRSLSDLAPELGAFLVAEDERRLVILSSRPEIHILPWESMVDTQWRSVAETELSIVHAFETFDEKPVTPAVPLTVQGIFGPGTEKRTRKPLVDLRDRAADRSGGRVVVSGIDDVAPGSAPSEAQVVQVEAHGDPGTGTLDLESPDRAATALPDALEGRAMVLLWSCFSALIHSWGESICLKLHRQNNAFVLGFATPLRFDTSEDLASRFYSAVFGVRAGIDPETAVVRERRRLYRDRVRGCEWAALTLWLRSPVDLCEAVFQGPRLLGTDEPSRELSGDERRLIETALEQALPGRAVMVTRLALPERLPEDLFQQVRGAAVHLHVDGRDDGTAAALKQLGCRSRSVHRGDRLLALLDCLENMQGSVLVWSGVGTREMQALILHGRVPPSVAVILVSPWTPPAWLAIGQIDGGQDNPPSKPSGWIDEISDIEELFDSGRGPEALTLAQGLEARGNLSDDQKRRLASAVYWAAVRLGKVGDAAEAVRRAATVDPFTGMWLEGNLLRRRGLYAQARTMFASAMSGATNSRDRARAMLELGGVAAEAEDPRRAERLFREAIATLEAVTDEPHEVRWHSALSRALRDLATLLAEDPARNAECEACIRRAMMLHNLDGRFGQVGAALKTRGVVERTRGRWDDAEEALATAAGIMESCGNIGGWASVIEELADLALRMGHHERALALIERARARIVAAPGWYSTILGRLAALEARVHWRVGCLPAARSACETAVNVLPADRVRERAAVGRLRALVDSLIGTGSDLNRETRK